MKRLLILVFTIGTLSMLNAQEPKPLSGKIKVGVDGLSCPFCAYGLEKKLKKMDGVAEIKIDVENAFTILTIKEGKSVTEEEIRKNVKDAGFTARKIEELEDEE